MYRRKSNTHTLVNKKFNIVIDILLNYINTSIITPQIPVDSENLHYFVDYEDQRICISLHTMNLELFCFCVPLLLPS